MTIHHRPFFLPVAILLVVELFVFSPALKKFWPAVKLLRFNSKTTTEAKPGTVVWAVKHSGLYYCQDSKVYGKVQPGAPMSQAEALKSGYRPAANEPCP